MYEKIKKILEELEIQSNLEKSRKVLVNPDERMLAITKETGELLNMLLRIKKAKNMLEIGTSVGYSTMWCAEAISENMGKIITIEQNQLKIDRAETNFQKAGLSDFITIKKGLAINILQKLKFEGKYQEYFDMVLIDADKENVIEYFDLILPMVSNGGVIITDNMLYPEKYKPQMKKLIMHIKKNPKLRTITSPIGNGEEITLKLG